MLYEVMYILVLLQMFFGAIWLLALTISLILAGITIIVRCIKKVYNELNKYKASQDKHAL